MTQQDIDDFFASELRKIKKQERKDRKMSNFNPRDYQEDAEEPIDDNDIDDEDDIPQGTSYVDDNDRAYDAMVDWELTHGGTK